MSSREENQRLGVGTRLQEPASAALVGSAFQNELRHARFLYEGVSYADLAHVLMLIEVGVVPEEPGERLLAALVELHDMERAPLELDARRGDLYENRDAELRRRLGKDAGWLHAGRARREALTIGWLLHLRRATAALVRDAIDLVRKLTDVAEHHAEVLMPDFTYLQHAHPTTLGHFLLGFAYPLLRDAERLRREWESIDRSPAGSASTNGSRLPLDRERLRELLGFAALTVHNRDAMWQSDLAINLMGVIVSLVTTADRLSEDLQIWATEEFGFVELADAHCRTSVIMPNKKNPYALAFIRGKARELTGSLVSVVATNQTPSGQIDNRNTSYDLLPRALVTAGDLARLLGDVLARAVFDTERLRVQAGAGFTFATELTDLLMQREGIDSRTAHEIVGKVVARQGRANDPRAGLGSAIEEVFRDATGQVLQSPPEELISELSPERIVANRRGTGSCSAESMRAMCRELRSACDAIASGLEARETRSSFPALLRRCVTERLGREW